MCSMGFSGIISGKIPIDRKVGLTVPASHCKEDEMLIEVSSTGQLRSSRV